MHFNAIGNDQINGQYKISNFMNNYFEIGSSPYMYQIDELIQFFIINILIELN